MAAWQLYLLVVPVAAVSSHRRSDGARVAASIVESVDWWRDTKLPNAYRSRISGFMDGVHSWAEDWQVFGSEDGDRIDIFFTKGRIKEVLVRFDVRAPDLAKIESICNFFHECGCLFLTEEGHVVDPTAEAVWIEVELSPASTFVHDPERFFRLLKSRKSGELP